MNRIITTDVLDPSIQQPFTANSLDFLQTAVSDILISIPALTNKSALESGNGIILYGCQKRDLGAGNYTFYFGYVYWNGEIFTFDGVSNIAIATNAQFKIVTTNSGTADPVTFTDGISRNVHNVRKVTIVDNTGDFNYSSCKFVGGVQETNNISSVGTTTVESTVATITTFSACSYLNVSWNCWITESGSHDTTYKIKKNGSTIKEFRQSVATGEYTISFTAISDCNYTDVFTVTVTHSGGSGQIQNGLLMIKN